MIVFDASVLIAHFEPADAHHQRATALLRELAEYEFWSNTITLAEFLVGPTRLGTVDAARQGILDLEIQSHGIGADGWPTLAGLRAKTGCKMPDCCVLYTAIELAMLTRETPHSCAHSRTLVSPARLPRSSTPALPSLGP